MMRMDDRWGQKLVCRDANGVHGAEDPVSVGNLEDGATTRRGNAMELGGGLCPAVDVFMQVHL